MRISSRSYLLLGVACMVALPTLLSAEADAPTHYYYQDEALRLEITNQFLVQLDTSHTPKRLAQITRDAGMAALDIQEVGPDGWYLLRTTTGFTSAVTCEEQLLVLLEHAGIDFVSPVFDGVYFGWTAPSSVILMRFAPGRSSGFQPVFLAGPVVAMNIGANVLVTNAGENTAFNVGDSIESAALGLVAGVGFRSQLGESAMLVQVRYHLGLTDVLRTPEDPLETDYSGTPADIMVMVGQCNRR